MTDIATTEPQEFTAGDKIQWKRDLTDYPANAGWVLTYVAINAAAKISITAAASGADHLVTIAATDSAAYGAGNYKWQAYVTNGTDRRNIESGTFKVLPNYAAGSTTVLDTRSHAKKVLDAIEAVLEGKATSDQQQYTIEGRSLTRIPWPELMTMRDKYRAEYQRELNKEDIAAGRGASNKIKVRL